MKVRLGLYAPLAMRAGSTSVQFGAPGGLSLPRHEKLAKVANG